MTEMMIQTGLIQIDTENDQLTVSARDLYDFLEVNTEFRHWFPRMCEYGFDEGVDFNPFKNDRVQNEGGRVVSRGIIDYQLTITMAKEICMIQRTDRGKLARQYFIKVEEAWSTPDLVMARALKLADQQLTVFRKRNSELVVQNEVMRPKAEYFDDLVERNLLTNLRDTAKELNIRQNTFVGFLLDHKYLYRDRKGKLKPYAEYVDGLFEIKEFVNQKTGWSGPQTLVTPRGRETFRLLCLGGAK